MGKILNSKLRIWFNLIFIVLSALGTVSELQNTCNLLYVCAYKRLRHGQEQQRLCSPLQAHTLWVHSSSQAPCTQNWLQCSSFSHFSLTPFLWSISSFRQWQDDYMDQTQNICFTLKIQAPPTHPQTLTQRVNLDKSCATLNPFLNYCKMPAR